MKNLLPAFGTATFLGLSTAGLVVMASGTTQAQTAWKTVSDAKTGVSISMPSGATVKPAARLDTKTGAKMASFEATQNSASGIYVLTAIRMNTITIDQLRKTVPAGKEPIDILYASKIQPQVDRLLGMTKQEAGGNSLTRKPITFQGIRGEEISGYVQGKEGKGGLVRMRILKNKDSVYVLLAGERAKTPESAQHTDRFFKSFTIASSNPLK